MHIGAHKTGTTYIQHMLEANRAALPLAFETVPRRQKNLREITRLTSSAQTKAAAQEAAPHLRAEAAALARRFDRVENLMISHEGLPGPLPGRSQFKGLYPHAGLLLPPIIDGLRSGGAEVRVVFYKRRFKDWQASLNRYRFQDDPSRAYSPKRFAERTGLPDSWKDFLDRLKLALGDVPLLVVSYEQDRETGLLGTALLQEFGLSPAQIAGLKRLPPQNVSRPETQHDYQFDR